MQLGSTPAKVVNALRISRGRSPSGDELVDKEALLLQHLHHLLQLGRLLVVGGGHHHIRHLRTKRLLQLRLQTTVEGLSIAAISYYVISLLLYGAKALKTVGVPLNPELAIGLLIPPVLWAVARATKRVHDKLHASHH